MLAALRVPRQTWPWYKILIFTLLLLLTFLGLLSVCGSHPPNPTNSHVVWVGNVSWFLSLFIYEAPTWSRFYSFALVPILRFSTLSITAVFIAGEKEFMAEIYAKSGGVWEVFWKLKGCDASFIRWKSPANRKFLPRNGGINSCNMWNFALKWRSFWLSLNLLRWRRNWRDFFNILKERINVFFFQSFFWPSSFFSSPIISIESRSFNIHPTNPLVLMMFLDLPRYHPHS